MRPNRLFFLLCLGAMVAGAVGGGSSRSAFAREKKTKKTSKKAVNDDFDDRYEAILKKCDALEAKEEARKKEIEKILVDFATDPKNHPSQAVQQANASAVGMMRAYWIRHQKELAQLQALRTKKTGNALNLVDAQLERKLTKELNQNLKGLKADLAAFAKNSGYFGTTKVTCEADAEEALDFALECASESDKPRSMRFSYSCFESALGCELGVNTNSTPRVLRNTMINSVQNGVGINSFEGIETGWHEEVGVPPATPEPEYTFFAGRAADADPEVTTVAGKRVKVYHGIREKYSFNSVTKKPYMGGIQTEIPNWAEADVQAKKKCEKMTDDLMKEVESSPEDPSEAKDSNNKRVAPQVPNPIPPALPDVYTDENGEPIK